MKKYFRLRTVAFLMVLHFFSLSVFSQDNLSSPVALAEKIYLQLDHTIYTTDQTIWFKAIVAGAGDHIPSELSGVLYAELIDPNENIIDRKLIKLEHGIGDGFFQLGLSYDDGIYQVRAYTQWNKNFGSGFVFKDYILVSGTEKKEIAFDPIKNLTLSEGQNGERRLSMQVDPMLFDSIQSKKLRFFVQSNGKKDTLSVKRNRSNEYLLDYPVAAESDLVTLQIANEDALHYAKTIVVDTSYIDLQFFAESGELVQGLPGFVGVKALDYEGRGRKIEGEIVNLKGEAITRFTTNELGMGTVSMGLVDSSAKYRAKIISASGTSRSYFLPPVVAKGNVLSIRKKGDKIIVRAVSNYVMADSIVIRASCRGILYFDFSGKLKAGGLEFPVDEKLLPEGIIDFTLYLSASMTPVAERLYFNERPEERLQIAISTEKKEYVQREETKIIITTLEGKDKPTAASLSFLAINQSVDAKQFSFRQNLLSSFLLSSDLKGTIENPGYYFEKGANRLDDLDALLLTQGWRKYNYVKGPISFRYLPERNLTVSGNVKGGLLSDNKNIKGAELTLMAFSKPPFFSAGTTDSSGHFHFELDDEYGDNIDVAIQSANKSNKKRQYVITLDKKDPPAIEFMHALSVRKPDSTVKVYIQQNIERKKTEDAYRLATDGSVMKEVIVTARSLSPVQKEVIEKFGEPSLVITGKEIQAKEKKWSYGLYSVLLFEFPDKVKITRYPSGMLYASLHNSETTLVVIDGIPVKRYEYGDIPGIPPGEVKSFELIPYAKNFYNLFCEAIYCGPRTPTVGNVIAIYTHAGKGLYGVKPPVGLSKMVVPVFSPTREFYAPKYDLLKPADWKKPDLRTLVYWAPKLKTDSTGQSAISFYNSDHIGPVRIIVEAISANGEIGYSELLYEVKKNPVTISP